ncbi:hypothetical protein ABZ128_08125 [Streptomyces sp. NPDC006326]|uniref:hypothetical protein n=1 Tax=Streptomyces sp. NPDC006326 TaxID=3156752 RepID=UPI0033A2B518
MRSVPIALRAAGVAVALTAFAVMSAPTALAAGESRDSVSAEPHQAEPGAQVKLRVRGCEGKSASAKSSVFVSEVHLSSEREGDGSLRGDAKISSHAQPGRHDVRVRCDGEDDRVRGSIEVVRHREDAGDRDSNRDRDSSRDSDSDSDSDRDRDSDRPKPNPDPRPHESPVGPVHAGGGGMAAELAESARLAQLKEQGQAAAAKKSHGGDGPGLPHTVIGAVLAAAATLAVAGRALTLRRRRSGQ